MTQGIPVTQIALVSGSAMGGPSKPNDTDAAAASARDAALSAQLAEDAARRAKASEDAAAQSEMQAGTSAGEAQQDAVRAEVAAAAAETALASLLGPTALYEQLTDPLLPLPAFVEGWALNSFSGLFGPAPTAANIPLDSIGQLDLAYTVSGAKDSQTLNISSGDPALGTGSWGAVLQHDNGTYGIYNVTGLNASSCTIFPALRATVTNQQLRNRGGAINGQHYTAPAYRALAFHVASTDRRKTYRNRFAARWVASAGVKADWTATGGLGAGQFAMLAVNPQINSAGARAENALATRGRVVIGATPTAPYEGKGLTKSFSLGGRSGFLEMFVSCAKLLAPDAGFYAMRVVVTTDGVTRLDQVYSPEAGVQRVLVDFPASTSGTVTVTFADNSAVSGAAIRIGDVTWWTYDRTPLDFQWTDPAIDKNAKTVVLGDSWTTFYAPTNNPRYGAFCSGLQAAMTAAGGTGVVVGAGTPGTTAEQGLADFDALVVPERPRQVVICYFTNDRNQYGVGGYGRWLSSLYLLGRRCQAIGARPVFISPLPTESLTQTAEHGIWAALLGAGLPAA